MGTHVLNIDRAEPWEYKSPRPSGARLEVMTTQPWHRDEFAYVAGVPVCYDWCVFREATVYRLPGGGSLTREGIRAAGLAFKLPRRARMGD